MKPLFTASGRSDSKGNPLVKPSSDETPIWFYSRRHRPYGAFSNFELAPVYVSGRRYESVEHWYQSQRAASSTDRELIGAASSPEQAYALGQRVVDREDWPQTKISVMYRGLVAKFVQHPDLGDLLRGTGTRPLHEDADDHFWGYAGGRGADWLGRLLGVVREHLASALGVISDEEVTRALTRAAIEWQMAAGTRDKAFRGAAWLSRTYVGLPDEGRFELLSEAARSGTIAADGLSVSLTAGPWALTASQPSVCGSHHNFSRAGGDRTNLLRQRGKGLRGLGLALPFSVAREMGAAPATASGAGSPNAPGSVARYDLEQGIDEIRCDNWRLSPGLELPRKTTVFIVTSRVEQMMIERLGWMVRTCGAGPE